MKMSGHRHNSGTDRVGSTVTATVFGFHQESDAHALHAPVLVLNASYEPINVCAARRAIVLVLKGVAMAEEENGEVPAFMIGDTCAAWWSNDQLRRLAERKQQEREAQEAEWSRMKGSPPITPEPPS